jgi:hypothetical protein
MNESMRQSKINESRLSVASGKDTSAVYFNNGMVLILLERDSISRDCLFFRVNTYDYVIGRKVDFEGNFQVSWNSGLYLNSINEVAKDWRV